MRAKSLIVLVAAAVAILNVPQATAADESGDWEFNIAPYLFAAGLDGTLTVKGYETEIDLPFSDIISDLHFAAMVHFDMQNERWVVSSDLIYVDLDDSRDVARGTVTASVKETLWDVFGGYRVSPVVTLLAGARYVDLSTGLRFAGQFDDPSADAGKSWVDPLVGVHVIAPFAERWWVALHGDIGGFGVGSEFSWQAYADVGFRASDLVSVVLGFRAIDIDYESGSGDDLFRYDMLMSGPQLGVAFRF